MGRELTTSDISDVLTRIGPDRIAGRLQFNYSLLIAAKISDYQRRNPNWKKDIDGDGPESALSESSLELLIVLWQAVLAGDPSSGISPRDYAARLERAIVEKIEEAETAELIKDALTVFGSTTDGSQIQRNLLRIRKLAKTRQTIKTNLMDAAKRLSALGLVECRQGKRRQQIVTKEIALTNEGFEFVRVLLRRSIKDSARDHPQRGKNVELGQGSNSEIRGSNSEMERTT